MMSSRKRQGWRPEELRYALRLLNLAAWHCVLRSCDLCEVLLWAPGGHVGHLAALVGPLVKVGH